MDNNMVNIEASITLNDIVREYIMEFDYWQKDGSKKEIELTTSEKKGLALTAASYVEELDRESIVKAIRKTISVMNDIEYNLIGGDLSAYKDRRRKVEQILSIIHVSSAYPANAVKRLKMIRPKVDFVNSAA
jgi:hypothetical protein